MDTQAGVSFGELLRTYRLTTGLTQEALAERAGLGVRTIRLLEQGGSRPHAATARHLAAALTLTGEEREQLLAAAQPAPRHRTAASRPP